MRVKRAPQTRHTCSSSSTGSSGGGRIHSASPTTSAPTATMKTPAPALLPNTTATVTARTAANGRAAHVATKRRSAREAGNSGSRCVRATATQEPGDPTVPQLIRVSHGQPTIETGRLVGIAAGAVGGPPGPASGVESPSPQRGIGASGLRGRIVQPSAQSCGHGVSRVEYRQSDVNTGEKSSQNRRYRSGSSDRHRSARLGACSRSAGRTPRHRCPRSVIPVLE
jgi:hypothetical protein